MKSLIRTLALIAICVALPAAAQDKAKPAAKAEEKKAAPAKADDKKAAAVPGRKVLFENEKYIAYESTFKPGEGSPARERPARMVRALTDGTMQRTYPDGKTEKIEWKAGQVRYLPKENFGNKNVGKTDVVLYIVEAK